MNFQEKNCWSVDMLANELHMTPACIRGYIRDGIFKAILVGRSYFILQSSVDAYLARQINKRSKAGRPKARAKK